MRKWGIINIGNSNLKETMIDVNLPPAPPYVEQFANEHGYEKTVEHYFWCQKIGKPYKDFNKVYMTYKKGTGDFAYILDKNGKIRFVTVEEYKELDIPLFL